MKKNKQLLLSRTKLYIAFGLVSFFIIQLYIYAVYMGTLYNTQKNQKKLNFYLQEKEEQMQKLTFLQNSMHIKTYAKHVLHMQPLSLEKIRKISVKTG
jgi:uncharacterized membrane protein YeiB